MQSAAVLRPLSQTRKVEGSICIRRLSQSPSVALGDSSRHVSLPSGLSLEARSVNKRDGESLCIVRSAVMEGSSSWDGDSWSTVSTKSYRFLCNSMSPFSRKKVYGGEVVKHKERGHLIEIEKRVIWGTEEAIFEIIQQEGRGETIKTSYVESRNGNYRKDNKRLEAVRK